MRTGHLFAGAGGGILADLINGHHPVWAVEWDAYACAVLRARFPGLHVIEGDVRGVDFRALAPVDAICGGFPCQDISAAGRGAGISGKRSGLYREVIRAVDAVRPAWVFLENSPRIRKKGRHVVIGDLVALGYSWRDGVLGAADVGAPHLRGRWWCLARRQGHQMDTDTNREGVLLQRTVNGGSPGEARARFSDPGELRADVPDAYRMRELQPQGGEQNERRWACYGGWWDAEPGVDRVAHGVANRPHRIRCLGLGQVPLAAAVAWRLLGGPVT